MQNIFVTIMKKTRNVKTELVYLIENHCPLAFIL